MRRLMQFNSDARRNLIRVDLGQIRLVARAAAGCLIDKSSTSCVLIIGLGAQTTRTSSFVSLCSTASSAIMLKDGIGSHQGLALRSLLRTNVAVETGEVGLAAVQMELARATWVAKRARRRSPYFGTITLRLERCHLELGEDFPSY